MMKKTLRFSQAIKSNGPVAFSAMVKPIGSKCNLLCNYCYYLDKTQQAKLMDLATLEEFTRQYIEGNDVPTVTFCWHGGEPLLAGLDFFEHAMELQKKYAAGKTIENNIQTNGTLIDQGWAKFFKRHNFLVGISIDGMAEVHDANRMSRGEEPTFERVMVGLEHLKNEGVEFNTLSAVSAASAGKGAAIYQFFKKIGSRYMQFLPVVEHTKQVEGYSRAVICSPDDQQGQRAAWSISGSDYGHFLVDIFDQWVACEDAGQYYVQIFDATLAGWCGVPAGVCSMNESCGDNLVVEHNGDVYSCDHFVYDHYKLGNLHTDTLRAMVRSRAQFNFGAAKSSALPEKCRLCRWEHLCHGECPKHRFDNGVSDLCAGLQHFFRHSAPIMEQMRDRLIPL